MKKFLQASEIFLQILLVVRFDYDIVLVSGFCWD